MYGPTEPPRGLFNTYQLHKLYNTPKKVAWMLTRLGLVGGRRDWVMSVSWVGHGVRPYERPRIRVVQASHTA